MKDAEKERYLGDVIHKSSKLHVNIVDRISKVYGIVANIKGIMSDLPLGRKRIETGLLLRQAWFVNSCLFNSEVWQKMTKSDECELEKKSTIFYTSTPKTVAINFHVFENVLVSTYYKIDGLLRKIIIT